MESQNKDEGLAEYKATDSENCESTMTLSKRQLKRLRKKEKWLANLSEKRAKEKMKLKMKKKEARENNIVLGPSRKTLKNCKMSTSKCKVRLALDFSFDHLMNSKDIAKCVNQLLRCYSLNRRSQDPMQFHIVNFNGKSKEEMSKHNGYQKWDVNFHCESYLDIFSKESLIYLTSDSDNVIENVEESKVYIVGAIVDHNSQKGLCYNIAKSQGIQHGRLPILEHLDMKSRKVLAINHVFEILLNVCNGIPWKDAFMKVLPQRKGAVEKNGDVNDVNKVEDIKEENKIEIKNEEKNI